MKLFLYPPTPLDKTGLATESKQDAEIVILSDIDSKLGTANTTLNNIESDLVAIAGYVDNIEIKIDATNFKLDTVHGDLLSIDSTVFSSLNTLNSINSKTTNIESNTSATATNVGYLSPKLDTISKKLIPVVAQVSALVDCSSTNIPASGALTLLTSTVDNMYKFQVIEDIGEYMALCTGSIGSEVAFAALPLGGGEVFFYVPSGTRVSIKSLNGSNITSGKLILNAYGLGQP